MFLLFSRTPVRDKYNYTLCSLVYYIVPTVILFIISFIVAHFTATTTSTELMSGAKSREWVHHNSTNQPTCHESSTYMTRMTFNFGHKCTTNESNANHLKSIFNKINLSFRACLSSSSEKEN